MSQSDAPNPNTEEKPPPSLKQWRAHYDTGKHKLATKLKIFDRGSRPSTDFIVMMNAPWDVSKNGLTKWWRRKHREMEIYDQRFVKERHQILGSNLAAAHFLVHRGGKVKFAHSPDWVVKDEDDEYDLPQNYVSGYVVEAIDANGINLYYEGLQNISHLNGLKFFSLRGCKPIDDFCLDRISSQYPRLEHLDVSNCKNVSERGLEALYRMRSLKTLVVTNHHASPAFELTCLMLEDCIPDLKCDIRTPEQEESEKKEAGA